LKSKRLLYRDLIYAYCKFYTLDYMAKPIIAVYNKMFTVYAIDVMFPVD